MCHIRFEIFLNFCVATTKSGLKNENSAAKVKYSISSFPFFFLIWLRFQQVLSYTIFFTLKIITLISLLTRMNIAAIGGAMNNNLLS